MKRRWAVPILLTGVAIVAWLFLRELVGEARQRSLPGVPGPRVVAIPPFELKGPGGRYVSPGGLALLLAIDLESVDGLRTVEPYPRVPGNPGAAPKYVILGHAEIRGDSIVLAARVRDRLQGRDIARAEARGRELISTVDLLAEAILGSTLAIRGPADPPCLACVTSRSSAALASYLAGEARYRAGDLAGAARELEGAVRTDSTFALAWLRLADVAEWTEEPRGLLPVAAARADRFSARLPARHAARARSWNDLTQGRLDGLETLESAARTWPDDPDVWALLGSTLFLVGSAGVLGAEKAERALTRATALRPTMPGPYVHRVDLAVASSDSARASALLDTLQSLAPGAWFTRDRRLRWTLAFGDPKARREASRALEGNPASALAAVREALRHPRQGPIRRKLLQEAMAGGVETRSEALGVLAWSDLLDGKPEAALRSLDDPALDETTRLGILYAMWSRGFDIPPEKIDDAARAALAEVDRPEDPAEGARLFFAAVWSFERGNAHEGRSALARFRRAARQASESGDPRSHRFAVAGARGIEGFEAERRGADEDAIRRFEGALRETGALGPDLLVNAQIRWWLAELHARRGEPLQALAYYDSFWWDPIAARRAVAIRDRLEGGEPPG